MSRTSRPGARRPRRDRTRIPAGPLLALALAAGLLGLAACGTLQQTPPGPERAFQRLIDAATAGDLAAVRRLCTSDSLALAERYAELAGLLQATAIPPDALEALARALAEQQPSLRGVSYPDEETALVEIWYPRGLEASLRFRQEEGRWRYDLARDLAPTVPMMEDAWEETQERAANRGLRRAGEVEEP